MITIRLIIRDREYGDIVEVVDHDVEGYDYMDARKAFNEFRKEYEKDMPSHLVIAAVYWAKYMSLWFKEMEI